MNRMKDIAKEPLPEYVPTLDEIRTRWQNINIEKVPMIFTSHALLDVAVLLNRIDELEGK